jgi:glycosyltransferase involved in cell wall biosynthesis
VSEQLKQQSFDIIHAHDWMTYKAAIKLQSLTGKPIISHIHATEFDRTGNNGINNTVYSIERDGFHKAHKVIAVSTFTKQKLIDHYDVPAEKIHVVHNSVTWYDEPEPSDRNSESAQPIVLFPGRLTLQKGIDHFLNAAQHVIQHIPHATFVIAGDGDMKQRLMDQAFHCGIADNVIFTGFLTTNRLRQLYQQADLLVMPSVSEPFGLTALEALQAKTPVLISKQSGVSEVIHHCLKVDFWDTAMMADKIIGVLTHPALQKTLAVHGHEHIKQLSWHNAAQQCLGLYYELYNG